MKRNYKVIPLIILIFSIIVIWVKPIRNMNYLEDVNIDELAKYKIENRDDGTMISEINNILPANLLFSGMGIAWTPNETNIDMNYKYYDSDYISLLRQKRYWNKYKEKIILFNATTYLILVPSANNVVATLEMSDNERIEITRADLEKLYGRDLNEYYLNTSLWKEEIIETINSNKKLKEFYNKL
jgi:hypothetical protein